MEASDTNVREGLDGLRLTPYAGVFELLGMQVGETPHFTEPELIELGVVSPEHLCRIRQGAGAAPAGSNACISSSTFAIGREERTWGWVSVRRTGARAA